METFLTRLIFIAMTALCLDWIARTHPVIAKLVNGSPFKDEIILSQTVIICLIFVTITVCGQIYKLRTK